MTFTDVERTLGFFENDNLQSVWLYEICCLHLVSFSNKVKYPIPKFLSCQHSLDSIMMLMANEKAMIRPVKEGCLVLQATNVSCHMMIHNLEQLAMNKAQYWIHTINN